MEIGIIGYGILGKSIASQFGESKLLTIKIKDPKYDKSNSLEEMLTCDFIFISVPTPLNLQTNTFESNILDGVLLSLKDYAGIIVLKSTTIPSKVKEYSEKYKNLIMVPEFLREKHWQEDAINQKFMIVGTSNNEYYEKFVNLYQTYSCCEKLKTFKQIDPISASMVKYTINSFLATKVIFMNQLYQIHKQSGATDSWEKFAETIMLDERIGSSHMQVPGHDGDFGYGGKCFFKDVNSFIGYAKSIGMPADLLEMTNEINNKIRSYKDWLDIEGATSH